jgi:hypothetical protein
MLSENLELRRESSKKKSSGIGVAGETQKGIGLEKIFASTPPPGNFKRRRNCSRLTAAFLENDRYGPLRTLNPETASISPGQSSMMKKRWGLSGCISTSTLLSPRSPIQSSELQIQSLLITLVRILTASTTITVGCRIFFNDIG